MLKLIGMIWIVIAITHLINQMSMVNITTKKVKMKNILEDKRLKI